MITPSGAIFKSDSPKIHKESDEYALYPDPDQ